jgi:hypothetical protein
MLMPKHLPPLSRPCRAGPVSASDKTSRLFRGRTGRFHTSADIKRCRRRRGWLGAGATACCRSAGQRRRSVHLSAGGGRDRRRRRRSGEGQPAAAAAPKAASNRRTRWGTAAAAAAAGTSRQASQAFNASGCSVTARQQYERKHHEL